MQKDSRDKSSFGKDFGQKVDLTASIRNILRNYPEGTAVLKELVQNADDAGARRIAFYIDSRHHGVSTLADPILADFQGISLLIYNDAIFSEEDFKSIQRIGDSLKKTSESSGKIGRFGIGFNAVYHWTDLPSFISSKYLVLLDPQARFLPNVNPSNPGKIVDFTSKDFPMNEYRDQFSPYELHSDARGGWDHSWDRPFKGTLFRLPLRTKLQAESSLLSKRHLSLEDAKQLLASLQEEAASMLLFLKNIEQIEIFAIDPSTTDAHKAPPTPRLLFGCSIADVTAELRSQRSFISDSRHLSAALKSSISVDFSLKVICKGERAEDARHEQWELCNQLGGPEATSIASAPENALLRLIPWGGVAACVGVQSQTGGKGSNVRDGVAYCFLPLPIQTQLPVMLNGFFELSSNRRDVWQTGSDMTGEGRTRANWNIALMRDILAPCYIRLLLKLRDLLGFSDLYQQFWPSVSISSPWDVISTCTMTLCASQRLLSPSTSAVTNSASKSISKKDSWIEVKTAVLLPASPSLQLSSGEEFMLVSLLAFCKVPVVECIPSLRATLEERRVCAAVATPAILRKALHIVLKDKNFSDSHLQSSLRSSADFLLRYCIRDFLQAPSEQLPHLWNDLHGLPLLPMRDGTLGYISIFNAQQVEAIDAMQSMGFHYLPTLAALKRSGFNMEAACSLLAADTTTNTGTATDTGFVGIKMLHIVTKTGINKQGNRLKAEAVQEPSDEEEEWQVFSAAADMLIDFQVLGPQEISFLCNATLHKHSSVKAFSSKLIPDLLAYILPFRCSQAHENIGGVRLDSLTEKEQVRVREFLQKFWRFAVSRSDVITAIAQAMHIVPVASTATDLNYDRLLPLSRLSNLIAFSRGDKKMSADLIQILQQLGGVHIVSPVVDSSLSCHVYWEYIHSPNRSGIISVLGFSLREEANKCGGDKQRGASRLFGCLTALQRDLLRAFFATEGPISQLSDSESSVLRDLPIFPLARDPISYTSLNASYSLLDLDRSKSSIAQCLYPREYLSWSSPQELLLLKQLKVKTVNRGEFYRQDLLPKIQTLYSDHPEEVRMSLRYMLEDLNYLLSEDQQLLAFLKTCACIPSNSPFGDEEGSSHTKAPVVALHRAGELFDPEELELVSLLGQECFPSILLLQRQGGDPSQPSFSPQILSSLRKIGLQRTVTWRGLVSCASSVAEMNETNAEQRQRKKFKGAQLLSFIDRHIADFMGDPEPEKEKEREKEKSGTSFSSLFGIKNIMGAVKGIGSGVDSSAKVEKERLRREDESVYLPQLVSIAWLPAVDERLDPLMPWPRNLSSEEIAGDSPSFHPLCLPLSCCASPRESVSIAEAWIASYSKRIIDTTPLRASAESIQEPLVLSNRLKKAFGWNQSHSPSLSQDYRIGPVTVALQLRELARLFSSVFSTTSTATGESRQRARELVTALIPQIYQHLNSCLRNVDSSSQHEGEEQLVLSILQGRIWLWMGDRFVSIDCVALTASVTAAPYLYQLPQDLQVYGKLLKLFKVRTSFSARDYIEALRRMAEDSGALVENESTLSSPLSEQLIDVSVSLATLLTTETSSSFLSQLASHSIYIPDHQGRLALSTTLVHDDVPWLSGQEYIHLRKSYRLCHPNLSAQVASRLGVQSMRLGLINLNLAQQLFQGSTNQVEGFGQAESLTSRLRTILDMYPDGNPIFSELIQNADDAGATRLDILLDETRYPTESLLDAKMGELQGPALVVRNDAVFTESDFRALARIGQGSKLERLSTTGRFGLGFNSTYHLTDTPSFLTGNYFVIFDPHCAYVPGTTLNQPGLRIKVTDSSLADAFPDQFLPFKQFGCDCRSTYPGTLFRFPLRTASMARHSEISKRSYALEELRTTLHQLSDQLPTLLLFLRNVKQISIYHKQQGSDGTITTPCLLSSAVAQVFDKEMANDQSLLAYLNTKEGQGSKESFYTQLLSTPDKKLPMCCYRLRVESRSCSALSVQPSKEAGTVSTNIPETVRVVEYLVMSGLQGGKAKSMACDDSLRHLKLVPLGAVAACLSVCKDSEPITNYPSTKGQLFCYLPVPSVTTRLPVHINALWELSSNRRDIWMGEDTNGLARRRADWNLAVMQDVLSPLYVHLMSKVHKHLTHSFHSSVQQQIVLSLLPGRLNTPWDTLQTAVFAQLADKAFLFSSIDGGRFVSFKEAYLLEKEKTVEDERDRLEDLLLMERLAVVRIAPADCAMLLDRNCVAGKVTPGMVRVHFRGNGASNTKQPLIHPSIADTNPQRIENATYLLQYCCSDLDKTTQSFEQLLGVCLLPLHSQAVTCFQRQLDAPFYYLAEDIELCVLQRCGASRIVTAGLGSHVLSMLKDASFASVCNVKAISPVELLMLVRTGMPTEWLTADRVSIRLNDETTHPTGSIVVDEVWLRSLWTYILETKSIDLFKEVLPIVPVLGKDVITVSNPPNNLKSISGIEEVTPSLPSTLSANTAQPSSTSTVLHLARISPRIPILHMSYASLPQDAIIGLADLNVFILHAKTLGNLTFSNTLTQLLQEPSPRGLLNSLNMISQQRISDVCSGWSVNIKQSMQDLVLDCLAKLNSDSLNTNDKQVLSSLPIWRRRKPIALERLKGGEKEEYGVLDVHKLCLPPLGVAEELLDDRFIVLRTEKDRSLYSLLDVPSVSQGAFYLSYALPTIKEMDVERIRVMTSDILSNLTRFEEQQPGLKIALRDCPLIRNQTGQYKTPQELFDPQERILMSILPPEMFPHSDFTTYLHSLRSLGLRMELDAEGVLQAASAIQADPASMVTSTLSKSEALLRYLEANIERFDQAESSDESNQAPLDAQVTDKEESGSVWKKKLRSIMWIAVHVNIPQEFSNSCIPWPQRMHSSPFATPSQCCNSTDIWYGSSCHRISVFEVRSAQLIALLGWDKPIPGRTLILQLLSLQQSYHQQKDLNQQSKLQESVSKIFPAMLKKLQAAFEIEKPNEVDLWLSAAKDKDFFWVEMSGKLGHGRYVRPSQLSFTQLSEINMEPFLFLVPPDYIQYKELLLRLGCQESFQISDLADLNRRFYAFVKNNNSTSGTITGLSTPNVQFVVCCLQLIYRLVNCEGTIDTQDTTIKETIIGLNLGPLYAPDKSNLLQLTTSLTFDDAPWISSLLSAKTCRFVHNSVDHQLATFLGCRSLREQLFAGEDIVCPHSSHLRTQVQQMSVTDVLDDLLALGDSLGATNFTCIFDDHHYPAESLMHPGLGFAQGPALLVYMQGNFTLSGEQISKLLTRGSNEDSSSSTSAVAKSEGMRLISCFALCDCLQILSGREFFIFDPVGTHLLSTSTGPISSTSVDAPSNTATSTTQQYVPKAQRYQLSNKKASSEQEDVLLRFPDQFQVFSSLPFSLSQSIAAVSPAGTTGVNSYLSPAGTTGGVSGAVLRMPLRLKQTPWPGMRAAPLTPQDLASLEEYFRNRATGSLLFGKHLVSLTLSHHSRVAAPAHTGTLEDVRVQLSKKSLPMMRQLRNTFLTDRSWDRKNTITKMFQTYVPVEIECTVVVAVTTPIVGSGYWSVENLTEFLVANLSEVSNTAPSSALVASSTGLSAPESVTNEEEWYMLGINGSKRLRQLASTEPYYSLKLPPTVCIASKVNGRQNEIKKEAIALPEKGPETEQCSSPASSSHSGAAYSSARKVMMTGLPFLIEGSFLTSASGYASNLNQPLLRSWNDSILHIALEHLCLKLIDVVKLQTDQLLSSRSTVSPQLVAQSFYRHWPTTSNKQFPQIDQLLLQCSLFPVLVKKPFFLCQIGAGCQFRPAAEVIFITEEMSNDALTYLRPWLPLTLCPMDLASDLVNFQHLTTLTPQYLRFHLSRDPQRHSRALREQSELLLAILAFLVKDLESVAAQAADSGTEDILRKKVKEMAGVPALFMVDGCVRTFPRTVAEQVAITSPVFHALLPSLISFFVHPLLRERFPIFKNPIFLELLFISSSSAASASLSPMFLAAHLHQIFPSIMLNRPVVEWALDSSVPIAQNNIITSNLNPQILSSSNAISSPSPLLLFNIWRSIGSESLHTLCTSGLGPAALLPVLSKGRRILLAVDYVTAVFQKGKEEEGDTRQREHLQRETDRLLSQNNNGPTVMEASGPAVGTSSALPSNTAAATGVLPSAVPDALYSALHCLGLPLLDFSLLQSLPNGVPVVDPNTPHASSFGRRLLLGLHKLFSANLSVVPYSMFNDSSVVQTGLEQEFLDFAALSIAHRRDILLAVGAAAPLTTQEIDMLKQLPLFTRQRDEFAVNLFDETKVSSTSHRKKVFWCNDPVLLQTLTDIESGPSRPALDSDYYSSANPSSSSLVLRYDAALVELYALLSVHELTPTVSVKEFVVPHIHKMSGEKRLQVMLTLSQQWAQYRTDPDLLQTLRTVPFLPSWTNDPPTSSSSPPSLYYRKAEELFLWTNEELLSTLTYPHGPGLGWVCRYYAPPELRTQQMKDMCCDLNGMVDINEQSMLMLIADIEDNYRSVSASLLSQSSSSSQGDSDIDSVCIGLSRRLLKYMLAEDRLSAMLQRNKNLAAKLGQCKFIPALRPLSVQSGGFVQYQEALCCWSECCMGGQVGSLAFTVLPELEEEFCPPLFHCSSLGITSSPSTEVVLRHLRNLTQSQLLDRWNTPRHPIAVTFLAIFQHLQDKWSSLVPSVKDSLASRPIVPVGHSLIMPSRVFFRLSEDLSPFMHEIPRCFGAVESLLKQLGCKETPLMADYASFLRDLTKETTAQGPQPLNPNELKAVLSIIGILAQQMEETKDSVDESRLESTGSPSQALADLCLPDEESRMRPAMNCMVSDDPWLKIRSAPLANAQQLYFLHPLLDRHLASAVLKVPQCSKVIEELLHSDMEADEHSKGELVLEEEEEQERLVRSQLNNPQFLQVMSSLILQYNKSRPITSTGTENSSMSHLLQISSLNVRFVKVLRTTYRLRPDYLRRNATQTAVAAASMTQRSSIGNETLFFMQHEKSTLLISRHMLSLTSNALSYEIAVSLGLCSLLHLDFSLATSIACILRAANHSNGSGSGSGSGDRVSDIPMIAEILRMDCESAELKELLRGQPGEVLTHSDLQLMELKPFRVFRVGEIIAFDDKDSAHRYGKIVNVGPTSGVSGVKQLFFKCDSSGTVSSLLSTEVFSFRSARETAHRDNEERKPGQKAGILSGILSMQSTRGAAIAKEEARKGPTPLPPAPSTTTVGSTKKPSHQGDDLDLMEALDGLLVRVGVPVSLEQREMMKRILELEASNRQISENLRVERSELTTCKETLNRLQGSLLCQICISLEVSHVLVPCGHTFCEQCLNQLNRQRCPNCRCNIQQKIRFFLPEKTN